MAGLNFTVIPKCLSRPCRKGFCLPIFIVYLLEKITMSQRNLLLAIATVLSFSVAPMAIAAPTNITEILAENYQPTLLARGGNGKDALLESLNLSTAQKAQIQSIRTSYQTQMASRKTSMNQAYATMKTLMANGNTSRSQLENQHRTVATLRREIADLQFQQMMDIRDVLTPTQRQEMAQYMSQRKENMRKQFGDRLNGDSL